MQPICLVLALLPAAQEPAAPATDASLQFPGYMGQGRAYTSRFDNSFNPAMAIVFDAVGTASEADDAELNGARLRLFEVDLASRIDPLGWAYAVVAFEDEGEESEVALEEGAMWLDDLGGNFSLRGGKYLADFGKWNSVHLHDRAYVFLPGPSAEFFGGELLVTGVELHHWFGVGDLPVRWSVGVAPDFGGHAHGDEEAAEPGTEFGAEALERRTPSNFLYTGRLTAQHDVGASGFFQWGISALHTPGGLAARADLDGDDVVDAEFEASQTTVALDLTLRLPDPAERTAHTASLETYLNSREAWDTAGAALEDLDAAGLWAYYEYSFDPRWSAGVFGSWWQHAGTARGAEWFTGADAAASRAVYLTCALSEFNRIRLHLGQDVPEEGEPAFIAALQWTVVLGNHTHPLDW
jgi:hypothetical protein